MKLTIAEAVWANAEKDAAIIRTKERGAVAISVVDRPDMWRLMLLWIKAGGIVEPYVPPPATAPRAPASPETKLRKFLQRNPDVEELLRTHGASTSEPSQS